MYILFYMLSISCHIQNKCVKSFAFLGTWVPGSKLAAKFLSVLMCIICVSTYLSKVAKDSKNVKQECE